MSEKKSLTEIVLMPLVLAIVGGLGTYFITSFQARHSAVVAEAQRDAAEEIARAQIESAERLAQREQALRVLEIYQDKMGSDNPEERKLALQLLLLLDPALGQALAAQVETTDRDQAVRQEARRVKADAATGEIQELIDRFNGADRLRASDRLVDLYRQADQSVRDEMVSALIEGLLPEDDKRSYRVNIYIALTLSRLSPAWRASPSQLRAVEHLKQTRNHKDPTFKRRVDEALDNIQVGAS